MDISRQILNFLSATEGVNPLSYKGFRSRTHEYKGDDTKFVRRLADNIESPIITLNDDACIGPFFEDIHTKEGLINFIKKTDFVMEDWDGAARGHFSSTIDVRVRENSIGVDMNPHKFIFDLRIACNSGSNQNGYRIVKVFSISKTLDANNMNDVDMDLLLNLNRAKEQENMIEKSKVSVYVDRNNIYRISPSFNFTEVKAMIEGRSRLDEAIKHVESILNQ